MTRPAKDHPWRTRFISPQKRDERAHVCSPREALGRCPHCGFGSCPLPRRGGNTFCPECGREVEP
jgi:membrane protease subunit (stomatin/prohibitin family)